MTIQEIIEMWNGCCDAEGGGGGDFTTAQVTIVMGSQNTEGGSVPMVAINQSDEISYVSMDATNPGTFQAVLYKGKQVLDNGLQSIESVSGNITYDDEDEIYIITGDCTITIYQLQL